MLSRFVLTDAAGANAVAQTAPTVAETAHIFFRQTPPARRQHITEKSRWLARRANRRLARMQRQAPAAKTDRDPTAPILENRRIVMEQREIVDVAQIPRWAQNFGAEVVETIEIDIGEKAGS
jgi:hypothetical protein